MNKELGCPTKDWNWEGQTYVYVLLLYKLWTSNLMQKTKINNICTHSYPNINQQSLKARGGQTYISSEDRLYKALVHIDGGQFKKFSSHSSSRALALFYILLRVNIDVKI